jgi:protein TonB
MAPLNPAIRMSPTQAACDANAPRPVYLVMLRSGAQQTFVVLRFDVDEAVLFDGETPLGMLPLGSRADSLWLALGERLDDDPPLRSPPPPLELEPPEVGFGDSTYVEELPDVLERVAPSYPESARKQSIEGVVWVMAKVGKDGDVHDAIVQAGPRELRDDALDAVWQWKFRPAKRKGEPIVVWVMVPVSFRLH